MTARPEFGDAIAVTQADADAAADLIERYFPTNSGMLSLAGSFRRGHLQGVWPYAFACHRTSTALPLAHPAAPQGEDMVEVPLMTEEDAWHDWACKDRSVVGETEAHLEGWDAACRYYGLIKPALEQTR